jgi:hypothetical protein
MKYQIKQTFIGHPEKTNVFAKSLTMDNAEFFINNWIKTHLENDRIEDFEFDDFCEFYTADGELICFTIEPEA